LVVSFLGCVVGFGGGFGGGTPPLKNGVDFSPLNIIEGGIEQR
jgi:hypothetical protein